MTDAALYVVATPIGNLEDITLRAKQLLASGAVIACEDTRVTGQLLARLELPKAQLVSCYGENETARVPQLIERLLRGESIVLVSDAGTPAVSDPGYKLVRAAHEAGVNVVPVPGASSVVAALSAAGLPAGSFYFGGFVERTDGKRRSQFEALRDHVSTLVFFDSPKRVRATLAIATQVFGAEREAAIARELTKTYESLYRGTLESLVDALPDEVRGEIVLIISGCRAPQANYEPLVRRLVEAGLSAKTVAAIVADEYGVSKRDVYQTALSQSRA